MMIGTATDTAVERYLARFGEQIGERSAVEPPWLVALRREAIARFGALGFPGPREEAWRFTPVGPVAQTPFEPARPHRNGLAPDAPEALDFPAAARLVLVNGHFAPALSRIGALPAGVIAGSLATVLAEQPERLEPHLARHASFADHPFVALNTAFFADGAVVIVPAGTMVPEPIHLVHLGRGEATPPAAFGRTLVVAGGGSQVTIVESFHGPDEAAYFNCTVTEVVAGPNAVMDYTRWQQESTAAFHVATLQIVQERDSVVSSTALSIGGQLVRTDVNARLDGEGVDCTLNGLYLAAGRQHVDTHMLVQHLQPHGTSRELYKGILDGRARAVFNGRIYVHRGAQKTDAKQSNRNLLLSDEALVNSNPQLEIFADDVRCTHGSTVGQLDEEALFYLRTRGIGAAAARSILTYAFASDILSRIKLEPVRRELEELLFRRLPRGEVVRHLV
jgi:Fe-S cluster assembly protein SufD